MRITDQISQLGPAKNFGAQKKTQNDLATELIRQYKTKD